MTFSYTKPLAQDLESLNLILAQGKRLQALIAGYHLEIFEMPFHKISL